MKLILAIDVGTTAIKFQLFNDIDMSVINSTKRLVPQSKINEQNTQNPSLILQEIISEITDLSAEFEISSLTFSTAMHTLIPVENSVFDASTMYLWSDMRANEEIKKFKKEFPELATEFYKKTGTPIHNMSPFAKLLFFKNNSRLINETSKWLSLKSYLMAFFTGQEVEDFSVASASGLFNSEQLCWDKDILNFLGLAVEKLPKLVDTNSNFPILNTISGQLGLSKNTKIFVGASDGVLASYAGFIGTGSKVSLTLGTSGAVRYLTTDRTLSSDENTFCYYLSEKYWVVGGPSNNGGQVLEWASSIFYEDKKEIFLAIPICLERSPIGANGVIFLPYVNGERAPLWDGDVTALFSGISFQNNKSDFVRAICEGILFNLKLIYNLLNVKNEIIALSGGFFDIPNMDEEVASIFDTTCIKSDVNEPTFGAVMLSNDISYHNDLKENLIKANKEKSEKYLESYESFYKAYLSLVDEK
ncbi:gluconokinase [Enterococcus aquimarinus]|uniref:gluconokinase n=1 Tax=Enterococcus aquimarinus TaxID=328396 RepID=UPI000A00B310|nr:FGGY family carbohydrate kinase [Enterococcus aquimarinus]